MREQIIAQISLGIISGDLRAGEKLPSTRELARRFQIHQNTVSNAYRQLAEQGLVEFKKGSGVYVRENSNAATGAADALDLIINRFFHEAAAFGFSSGEIKERLQKRLAANSPKHFLVVESDAELRKILVEEVRAATGARVDSASFEEFLNDSVDDARIALIFDKASDARQTLPPNKTCIFLKANSVADSMTGKARPSENDLIAVVSGWEKFLELAKMFLLAARIAPDALLLRSPHQPDWRNGLQTLSLIICDSATAKEFPDDNRVRIFQLIADSSLNELRKSIE